MYVCMRVCVCVRACYIHVFDVFIEATWDKSRTSCHQRSAFCVYCFAIKSFGP